MNILIPLTEALAIKTGCDLVAGNLIGINKPKATAAYSVTNSVMQIAGTIQAAMLMLPIASFVTSSTYFTEATTANDPVTAGFGAISSVILPAVVIGWAFGAACGKGATERTGNPLSMREVIQLNVASTLLLGASLAATSL